MLYQKIYDDMLDALRAKDKPRTDALRSVVAAMKLEAINAGNREEISDDIALKVLKKQVKQRKESIVQFEAGGRKDLADIEALEMQMIEPYLPASLSREEVAQIVLSVQAEHGFQSKADMGKLMGKVMAALSGQEVEGSLVKEEVSKVLV